MPSPTPRIPEDHPAVEELAKRKFEESDQGEATWETLGEGYKSSRRKEAHEDLNDLRPLLCGELEEEREEWRKEAVRENEAREKAEQELEQVRGLNRENRAEAEKAWTKLAEVRAEVKRLWKEAKALRAEAGEETNSVAAAERGQARGREIIAKRLEAILDSAPSVSACPCGDPVSGPPCTAERPCPYAEGFSAERWGLSREPGDRETVDDEADAFALAKAADEIDDLCLTSLQDWTALLFALEDEGWRIVKTADKDQCDPEDQTATSGPGSQSSPPSSSEPAPRPGASSSPGCSSSSPRSSGSGGPETQQSADPEVGPSQFWEIVAGSMLVDPVVRELTKQIVEGPDGEVISLPYEVVKDGLADVLRQLGAGSTEPKADPEVPRCGGTKLDPRHPNLAEDCAGCVDCEGTPLQQKAQALLDALDTAEQLAAEDGARAFNRVNRLLTAAARDLRAELKAPTPTPLSSDCQSTPELLGEEQWCGECGLKLSADMPASVWTGHTHKPVSAEVMDAAWSVFAVVEAAKLDGADSPEGRASVLRLMGRAGITEQAVRMYGRSASASTQPESPGTSGEAEAGEVLAKAVAAILAAQSMGGRTPSRRQPIAKPQPDGGLSYAEAKTHQRYLSECLEIANQRIKELEAEAATLTQPVPGNSEDEKLLRKRLQRIRAAAESDADLEKLPALRDFLILEASAGGEFATRNSGGVEEGRWQIEDSGDWLSRSDALTRKDAISHTAKRLAEFFKAEGEPCSTGEAVKEAAEIVDAAHASPNVEQEQDGVCVTFVTGGAARASLAAASTQPPSPEAPDLRKALLEEMHRRVTLGQNGTKLVSLPDIEQGINRVLADRLPSPEAEVQDGRVQTLGEGRCPSFNAGPFRCELAEGHDGDHLCITPRRTMRWASGTGKQSPAELQGEWPPVVLQRPSVGADPENYRAFHAANPPEGEWCRYVPVAEPQGDVVEAVEYLRGLGRDTLKEAAQYDDESPEAEGLRGKADGYNDAAEYLESNFAAITPLLPGSNYALELRERLEGLKRWAPDYQDGAIPQGTIRADEQGELLRRADVLAVLDTPVSSEPEEGK